MELLGFSQARQKHATGGDTGGMVEEGQLQGFPGDLTRIDEVGRSKSLLPDPLKSGDDQGIGFDVFQWSGISLNSHLYRL